MNLKKITGMVLSVVIGLSALGTSVHGVEGPSEWATTEVQAAIDGGLVPVSLRQDYQSAVARHEYVLLALEILKDSGIKTEIIYERPFTDISGHPSEAKVIEAYNAGLIRGYGDGKFGPDDAISREQIATLVVNLMKILDKDIVINQTETYTYSDEDQIGAWARQNIDYCVANGILKGTGVDGQLRRIIEPKGLSSREQAMVLLYRLALDKGLYKAFTYKNIQVGDGDGETDYVTAFNEFATAKEATVTETLYDLQQKSYASLSDVSHNYIEVSHKDGSNLSYNASTPKSVRLELKDLDNLTMLNAFKKLTTEFQVEKALTQNMAKAISAFRSHGQYQEEIPLKEGLVFITEAYNLNPEDADNPDMVYSLRVSEVPK